MRQSSDRRQGERMSMRKPLVRFDITERAQIAASMPGKKTKTKKPRKKVTSSSSKARVVKGRLNIKVVGYPGIQKVPPSQLIPYLPVTKLRQAAKKALDRPKAPVRRKKTKPKKKNG